jgi:hypothetical protein
MVICLSGQMGLRGRPLANAGDGRNDRRTREGGLPMNDNGSLQHRASEAVRHATALSNRHYDLNHRARQAVRHALFVRAEIVGITEAMYDELYELEMDRRRAMVAHHSP